MNGKQSTVKQIWINQPGRHLTNWACCRSKIKGSIIHCDPCADPTPKPNGILIYLAISPQFTMWPRDSHGAIPLVVSALILWTASDTHFVLLYLMVLTPIKNSQNNLLQHDPVKTYFTSKIFRKFRRQRTDIIIYSYDKYS